MRTLSLVAVTFLSVLAAPIGAVTKEEMQNLQNEAKVAVNNYCRNQLTKIMSSPLIADAELSEGGLQNLSKTFNNSCNFVAQHTLEIFDDDNSTFVTTGDIYQMWLRDSCKELLPYLAAAPTSSALKQVLESAMHRMLSFYNSDPYSSAFYSSHGRSQGQGPNKGECPPADNCPNCECTQCAPVCGDYTYQKDYELDSPLHMFLFFVQYREATKYPGLLPTDAFRTAVENFLRLSNIELYHNEKSKYYYKPLPAPIKDGVGLVWSFARPSDGQAAGYSIPDNIMLVAVCRRLLKVLAEMNLLTDLQPQLKNLADTVEQGVEQYGVVQNEGKKIYAYEVDGFGKQTPMDDANLPNLLWIPYLGYTDHLKLYNNTRSFTLSHDNENYFTGTIASGLGSQHATTGYRQHNPGPECYGRCVWHLGLIMEGFTTTNRSVKVEKLRELLRSTSGQYLMHEGFSASNANDYNRDWFGWADSLFVKWMIDDWTQ